MKKTEIVPLEIIQNKILFIRGYKVMIDKDLALLYGVPTKRLNEQVRRNIIRFPKDFMFQLTKEETEAIQNYILASRSQIATLKKGKNIKYLPYVFTEQGIAMLSSVLNNERAALVNIAIMRIFVKLRKIIDTNKNLVEKISELEKKYNKHDDEIAKIFTVINRIIKEEEKPKKKLGFL